MINYFDKVFGTIAVAGVVAAIISGILYFVDLPIFSDAGLAWLLTFSLISAGVTIFALISKNIWSN